MQYGLSIAFSDPSEYGLLAKAAEDAGFSWVTLADHLVYPQTMSVPYPYTPDGKPRFSTEAEFPEPWTAVTAMAQHTRTIGFYTNVYVLPVRNVFHVAKQLATCSAFTGGRIALGAGVGWMPEEFVFSGQDFKRRGKHTDEMLTVMKKLWSGEWVSHAGEFYNFPPVKQLPRPVVDIPIFVGGVSDPAMRRAAAHDGWISDLHTIAELKALIARLTDFRQQAGTAMRSDFQILCFNPVDAVSREHHKELETCGVTTVTTMPWALKAMSGPITLADKLGSIEEFAKAFIA